MFLDLIDTESTLELSFLEPKKTTILVVECSYGKFKILQDGEQYGVQLC